MFPTEQVCVIIDNDMFVFAMLGDAHTHTLYTDLTGQFQAESYDGMNYIFVAYIYKPNAILLQPIKSRENTSMVLVFQSVHAELETKGRTPNLHVLDNKCSRAVKNFIATQKVPIQIAAPTDTKILSWDEYNQQFGKAEH